MAVSWDGTYPFVEQVLRECSGVATVLDIGAGEGRLGDLARFAIPDCYLTGVECWEPLIAGLTHYDRVIHGEALATVQALNTACELFDVALAGDVLEHLEEPDASRLLDLLREVASVVVVTCPLGPGWEQGAVNGNEWETHRWAPLPSWFLSRGAKRMTLLSARDRSLYGYHRHLDEWILAGHIPQAIGVFVFERVA